MSCQNNHQRLTKTMSDSAAMNAKFRGFTHQKQIAHALLTRQRSRSMDLRIPGDKALLEKPHALPINDSSETDEPCPKRRIFTYTGLKKKSQKDRVAAVSNYSSKSTNSTNVDESYSDSSSFEQSNYHIALTKTTPSGNWAEVRLDEDADVSPISQNSFEAVFKDVNQIELGNAKPLVRRTRSCPVDKTEPPITDLVLSTKRPPVGDARPPILVWQPTNTRFSDHRHPSRPGHDPTAWDSAYQSTEQTTEGASSVYGAGGHHHHPVASSRY